MKTLLWTMGSFYLFGEQCGFDLFLQVIFQFVEKTHISMLIVYLPMSIITSLGKGLLFI